jgi:hypothetical protein
MPRMQHILPISDEAALLPRRPTIKEIDEIEMIKYWNSASKI